VKENQVTVSLSRAARPLVAPLVESRPAAQRWCAAVTPPAPPSQPTLDLRPAADPVVLASPADVEDRTAPGLPDARAWSVALAVTLLEVVTARRPSSQLSRWLAEDVLDGLGGRLPGRRGLAVPPAPVALQSVRVQYPRTGVAEVSVHARIGDRSVAMALRLEARGTRWLCTALELGPLP
jgi:hypothetical protein